MLSGRLYATHVLAQKGCAQCDVARRVRVHHARSPSAPAHHIKVNETTDLAAIAELCSSGDGPRRRPRDELHVSGRRRHDSGRRSKPPHDKYLVFFTLLENG